MKPLDMLLEQALVRVTEEAAVAAAHTMGFGVGKRSDGVAVESMRRELAQLPMAGRIVIGEGERDKAPRSRRPLEEFIFSGGFGKPFK